MKPTLYRNPLPVPATGTKAETKDAEFKRKVAALRAATGRPERFVQACACAVHDRAFTVVHERTDPTRPFVIAGIHKVIHKGGDGAHGDGAERRKSLPIDEVDWTGWRCPWCGDDRFWIACDDCETTICAGRTRERPGTDLIFECRASCGSRSTLVPAQSVSGAEANHVASARRGPPSGVPALPRNNLPLLGGRK